MRALTYRLERIRSRTAADPVNRYALRTAVIGARLLGRPGDESQ